MTKKNDRMTSRPSISRDEDSRAGDEGLEEDLSAARPRQNEHMQSKPSRSGSSNVQSDDVRDPNSINRSTEQHRSSESGRSSESDRSSKSSRSFEGQGGQKGGSQKSGGQRSNQGTGYTGDRSGPLQEDKSLSSRPGKSDSRQSESARKNVSTSEDSESDRSSDDVDRTLM
jgi:hypothetical protein